MARFRSPITGRFVNLAAVRRWNYAPEPEIKPAPPEIVSEIPVEDDFFFEEAEQLEDFEFDELADLDFRFDEFVEEVFEEFEDVEETDYEEVV